MIKTCIIFLLSLNICFAVTVEECSNQLSSLGNGNGKVYVDSSCYESLKAKSNSKTIFTDDILEIIAHKNSFYVKDLISKKELKTAGRYTNLKDIIAMDYDDKNKEVVILERNTGDLLFFSSVITGNVAPYRTIRTEQLVGAVDVKVSNDEVFVLNSKDNSVLVYNRLANVYGRKDHKKLEILRSYNNIPSEAQSIEFVNDEISLLDIQKKKITYNFSKN